MTTTDETEDKGKSPRILAHQLRLRVDALGGVGESVSKVELLRALGQLAKFAEQTEERQNASEAEISKLQAALLSLAAKEKTN